MAIVRFKIDGAAQPNPGRASCAAVMFHGQKTLPVLGKSKYLGITTNNVAEHQAFVLALCTALAEGYKSILVQSDSKVVVNQFNGGWQVQDKELAALVKLEKKIARKFNKVTIEWVGRAGVTDAHNLADVALKHNTPEGTERTYKMCYLEEGEWKPI